MMSIGSEKAASCFESGFSCSQAVLISHSEELGLDSDASFKISCAFGGGMAHTGETCGAVTGALMLIGLKYGRCKAGDLAAKDLTYEKAKEFSRRFKEKHGSVKCTELLDFDLSDDEELRKAREAGVFKSICPRLVKESVEIVEELLES
jgi:C_GCAxxG_C_C family probable redox protein